jgi:hypothetical protein
MGSKPGAGSSSYISARVAADGQPAKLIILLLIPQGAFQRHYVHLPGLQALEQIQSCETSYLKQRLRLMLWTSFSVPIPCKKSEWKMIKDVCEK